MLKAFLFFTGLICGIMVHPLVFPKPAPVVFEDEAPNKPAKTEEQLLREIASLKQESCEFLTTPVDTTPEISDDVDGISDDEFEDQLIDEMEARSNEEDKYEDF